MTVLEFILIASKVAGTVASIVGGIDLAIRRFCKSTSEDLFKKCFVAAVKRNASNLANLTATADPSSVEVDNQILNRRIASLKDIDISTLTSLEADDGLAIITAHFRDCIILPSHQLTEVSFDQRIRPVLAETIADFYDRLPFKQEAFNQIVLEFIQQNTANQAESFNLLRTFLEELEKSKSEIQSGIMAVKEDTSAIKEKVQATYDGMQELRSQRTDLSNRHINEIVTDAVATEHLSEIDTARDLLNKLKPGSALDILDKLRERRWDNVSDGIRYRILATMGAAHLALNKEQEAARLLIEAFQYNSEDEKALANRAFAHFLLGEHEKAVDYANKTLERNPVNADAHAILVGVSVEGEALEDVINKVPEYLWESPRIACAFAGIAKERGNFKEAIKWGETMVKHEKNDLASSKAALATTLFEQVSTNRKAMLTSQIADSQKAQLRQAIRLFTEAWDCVAKTELRTARTDWLINKSSAHSLLGEPPEAVMALDTAIEIEGNRPELLMRRALLSLKHQDDNGALGFLQDIQSNPETPEAPLLIANILLGQRQFSEAITILSDFLSIPPSSELRNDANRLLIKIYIALEDFDEAQQISEAMLKSSPTSVLNLVDSARISKATGQTDEALSQLKETFRYAQNSQDFQAIIALADELFNYREFEKAAGLYEQIADTRLNSQWTMCLLDSYYHSGERKKTLEICRNLREKYGPLQKITEMEFLIYNEIGDMNQARAVGEMYVNAFPSDIEMQIRLAVVYSCSNNISELDCVLDKSFDLESLTLRSYFDLAHLYQIRSKPQRALDIMYEARRRNYANEEAHLKYIGSFLQVDKQIGELLDPNEVQPGTAVCLENAGQTNWYIVEERENAHLERKELNVDHPLAQRLLGKTVNDKVCLQQNLVSQQTGKITDIKSKYVYAYQDSLRTIPELFPDVTGFGVIKLDESPETDDSEKIRPILDFLDRQDETSRQMEEFHKEHASPIGTFMSCTGRDFLDMWSFLMNKPDLGIRCSAGDLEESIQAHNLLENPVSKIIVDPISLLTIHRLGAADTVVKAFGRLGVAQSTIDELQHIINQREGMWSDREHMSVGKEGERYVKSVFTPEQVRKDVEYLKGIVTWVRENCDILPCNAALEVNYFSRQKLNDLFQAVFIDTLLIASEPGYLLLSDDERLRLYAKTDFSVGAGINLDVDGVWTQAVLEHCVNKKFLGKAEYNKMTIKLVCSHYYHTTFDAEVLMEAVEQSNWIPSEPYTTLVTTLANQGALHSSVLDVAADFLYRLWTKPILPRVPNHLTLALLDGLTSGRRTQTVLKPLIQRLHTRLSPYPSAKQDIFSLIEAYVWSRPI